MSTEKDNFSTNYCPVYRGLDLYKGMSEVHRIERTTTKIKRTILVSLFKGDDLVPIVKRICLEEGIRGAFISAIGAADRIPIAAFNIETGRYDEILKTGYHEITSVDGNVSTILDDDNNAIDLMVHLHISFADTKGNAYGGHLLPGFSSVAVGEVYIKEIDGGMFRYKSEIDRQGYSTIKFNIPINKDLIPICKDNMDICEFGSEILTKEDAKGLVNSGCKRVTVSKVSNITSEASEYLKANGIDVEILEPAPGEMIKDIQAVDVKKVNWDEVLDIDRSFGGALKAFTSTLNLNNIDILIGEFKKGERLKKHLHKHPTEEVYYMIEGEVEVTIDDEKTIAKKGDLLFVPPEVVHWPINQKDEVCRILFILSPKEKESPTILE
ncbi:MAG: DUF296 domain-containing protein [Actinobacteria bacterium]|nr:DUF296 domain-containing protein [Actinomycetota bacterium]